MSRLIVQEWDGHGLRPVDVEVCPVCHGLTADLPGHTAWHTPARPVWASCAGCGAQYVAGALHTCQPRCSSACDGVHCEKPAGHEGGHTSWDKSTGRIYQWPGDEPPAWFSQ